MSSLFQCDQNSYVIVQFNFQKSPTLVCTTCMLINNNKMSFSLSTVTFNELLELISMNLWGLVPTLSHNGFRYYISFVYHFTRYTWIILLTNKSNALSTFVTYKKQMEKQFGNSIKSIQINGDREFLPFLKYVANHVILF